MESNLVQNLKALKTLPENWNIHQFGEVISDNSGGNRKLAKPEFLLEGNVAIVDQGKKMIAGYYNDTSLIVKTKPPYIVFGDHTRIFKYVDFPFVMGADGTKVLQAKKDYYDTKYLYYFFLSINVPNTGYNRHFKYLKNLKIPLPPLATQKKIAATLDEADKLRQLNKQLIEKYDALTQSLFLDMFGDPVMNPKGWEKIKLGNVCGVGSSKRVFVDELVEDGIPFYRGTEVGKLGEGKSIDPTLFITKEHYERLKEHRGIPKKGDLLMPSICPDGRIWVVDNDKEFYFKDGRVLWIEVDSKKMNSIYLRYHLKGSFFANYNNIASGTTFAELKIVALKKMNIFYPDMKLQNQFSERIDIIEQQKAQAQEALAKSEDLFHSLLQKAFKGALVK